jgi:hypothetical protein
VDFLSWDEADPARRGRALAPYVAAPVREERLVAAGWSGRGRQRAELAFPGRIVQLGATQVLVHVRVRVTPFRRRSDLPADQPAHAGAARDVLLFPAGAPAPSDPRWEGLDSYWYELLVPLREGEHQWHVEIGAVIVVPPVPDGEQGLL